MSKTIELAKHLEKLHTNNTVSYTHLRAHET